MQPDFTVRDEGTLVLFTPHTPPASEWWGENVEEGQTFAGSYVVKHRCADDLFNGLIAAGFTVAVE